MQLDHLKLTRFFDVIYALSKHGGQLNAIAAFIPRHRNTQWNSKNRRFIWKYYGKTGQVAMQMYRQTFIVLKHTVSPLTRITHVYADDFNTPWKLWLYSEPAVLTFSCLFFIFNFTLSGFASPFFFSSFTYTVNYNIRVTWAHKTVNTIGYINRKGKLMD